MEAKVNTHTLEIHEANTAEQFAKLRDCWNDVLRRSSDNSPFLTWEHIGVSVQNLRKNQKLRILYVTSSNKIIAIAPLRQSFYSRAGFFNYSVIEPLDYGVSTDYNGLILTEKVIDCLRLLFAYLGRQKDWDFLCINDVPEKSTFPNALIQNSGLFPKFKIEKGTICPYIELPDSMDKFTKGLQRNYRKNLAKRLRNLSKDHGKVTLEEYYELGTLEQAMLIFFDLHQKRWVSKGGLGAFQSKETQKIFM